MTSHNIAGVDVQGDLNITGLIAGHDLNEFKDVLYKSRANIVTGVKTLTHVTVDNDIVHAGKVNGLSDLKTDLLFLGDTKVAEGKFTFSEVEVKNLQVNGLVDGVNWGDLIAKRLLRDTEQTISATYTFGPPMTRIRFQGDIEGNDGDEHNAELNGQKISSIQTAENAWTAVGAVKVAAQVEANVLCHHVKDLNKAYLRNLKVDFIQKLATAPITSAHEVMNMDTLQCGKDIYLVVLYPSRVITAKLTDSSIENINSHAINPFNQGNPIDTAYDFQVVSKEIRESNGFSFIIASAEGISSYEIDTSTSTSVQSKDFTLHFASSPFRVSCVDQTQTCFVAIQDEIDGKFRMRIVQLDPPTGYIELWIGEKYSIKIGTPDFDLIMIKEKLYFAISDRQNHEKLNHLSVIEVDVTYPSPFHYILPHPVHYSVNNTITVPISDHDFLLIAPRQAPLIVASKLEEVIFTL